MTRLHKEIIAAVTSENVSQALVKLALVHFVPSRLTKAANSFGVLPTGVAPRSGKRCFMSALASDFAMA